MRLRVVCRKLYDYIRYDLKEIAFPSSLPDPPHIKKQRKLTWKERWYVLKEATRIYAASWVRDIGPDLRPNDYKNKTKDGGEPHLDNTSSNKETHLKPSYKGIKKDSSKLWKKVRKQTSLTQKEMIKTNLPDISIRKFVTLCAKMHGHKFATVICRACKFTPPV